MRSRLILCAWLMCGWGICETGNHPAAHSRPKQISVIAKAAVGELAQENYDAFFARFDDTMKTVMPESKLTELWKSILAQAGAFRSEGAVHQEKAGSYDVVFVTCQFERIPLDIKLVFNAKRQVVEMLFSPSPMAPASAALSRDH